MENEKELSYEMVMKMFAETDKQLKEKFAETDKRLGEKFAELAEDRKEASKQIKELTKNIGGISNSNGDMAEEMIYNSLEKDKTFGGIKFDEIDRNIKLKFKKLKIDGEYDVVLQNGDTVAIIETKYKVREKDVSKLFGKQLNDFRQLFPMFKDYKIILGIGGMSFEDKVEDMAKEKGIGIIKIVGDKVEYHTENIKMY
jgi:hypothetical protein